MATYKVTFSALWHGGKKYKRGDIIETDEDLGSRVEPYTAPAEVEAEEKPKRKRKRMMGATLKDDMELMS